jgi:hypothetical protein
VYQTTIGERILDVVRATPGCNLEEVTRQLPDLPWSQVFREVVTLRWLGQLELNESTLGLTTTLSPSSTT